MERKLRIKRIIFAVLTVLCIAFIFTQSLLPASKSSQESSRVLDFLNGIAEFLGLGSVFTSFFVRKCAHFFEFFVLSLLVFNTLKVYKIKTNLAFLLTPICYISVAVIDECIQIFSDGRASQFIDVVIDSAGGMAALLIMLTVFVVQRRKVK